MRKLSTYIEYTLMTKHYTFVPGMGGFLLRDVDASYSHRTYTPAHREVHFNRFLTKDDGMLANAYMKAEGMTYDEAIAQIRIEVAAIMSALNHKKSYELGSLGTLMLDSEHYLTIKSPKHFPMDPENFGLQSLSIRTWQEIEDELRKKEEERQQLEAQKKEAEVISIPKYWIRRAVAVVALALCFLATTNTNNDSRIEYAAMFDTDVLFGTTAPMTITEESWDNSWENEIILAELETYSDDAEENFIPAEESVEVFTETETVVATETTETIEAAAAVEEKQPVVTTNNHYYIIIGSCSSEKDANRFINRNKNEGLGDLGILECEGRFRIFTESYPNREACQATLREVRANTKFQTAWMLKY